MSEPTPTWGGQRPGAGAPSLDPNSPTVKPQFTMTQWHLDRLNELAIAAGISRSEMVRRLIEDAGAGVAPG